MPSLWANLYNGIRLYVLKKNSVNFFMGIDPSLTGTGLVLINEDYSIRDMIKLFTPALGVERLFHLQNKLLEVLDKYTTIRQICVEGPALRETGRIFDLGQWAGILYLELYKRGIHFTVVAPLQLKKYVSAIGKNQGKQVVILDVFKNFGEEIRDNDLADAYVLARIAHDFYGLCNEAELKNIKKYQLEVLNKLFDSEKNKNGTLL
jgi:crossover junction endodeoxyribonuclease RuvC